MLPVKLLVTDKVFLEISPLEESIVAKIRETFLCNPSPQIKTFPIGKSICESSFTGEICKRTAFVEVTDNRRVNVIFIRLPTFNRQN